MASWADTQPPTFAPYIQQQPVEQMVAVGMEKQRRYDEGVRRIQANIDRVAGLDIMRDVDRSYLESKLNQLGKDLQTVAAGDFSNYQLVSSVSGMASRLAKDPVIMNSVKSTAWYRKQVGQIQKDNEEGKYNPANIFDFNRNSESWLNSSTPGESFGQSYKTPIDVWAKIKDIAKEVGVDSEQLAQLYKTDERGNILKDENGNVMWNEIMVEKTLKGKDAGKILKAFSSALTPADFEQLAIEGRYNYRNYTPQMIEQHLIGQSKQQLSVIDDQIQQIKSELYKETSSNQENKERVRSLNDMLEHYQKLSGDIKSSVEREIDVVYENPDGARASIYTNNYLTNMSEALSSQETSTKYSVSPMFKVMMDYNRVKKQKEADDAKAAELGRTGEVTVPVDTEDVKKLGERYEEGYKVGVDQLNQMNYRIALHWYKKTNENTRKPGETEAAFDNRMKQEMYSKSEGDLIEYTTRIAAKQIEDWNNSGNVPAHWASLMKAQNELSKTLEYRKSVMEDVDLEARERVRSQGLNIFTDEDLKKYTKGKTVRLGNNPYGITGEVRLSEQDMIDFVRLHPGMQNMFGFLGTSKEEREEAVEARDRLMKKFPSEFNALEHELFGITKVLGQKVTPTVWSPDPDIRNIIGILGSSAYDKFKKIKGEIYKERGVMQQAVSRPVLRNKTNIDDIRAVISNVIGKYSGGKGVDEKELQAALLSDDNNAVRIITYPGEAGIGEDIHTLMITNENGKESSIQISNEDYRAIMRDEPPASRARPPVTGMLDLKGTTNRLGTESPDGAWFSHDDFVNFDMPGFSLTGDLVQDMYDSNTAWLMLYLRNNSTNDYKKYIFPGKKGNFRLKKYNDDRSYNINLQYVPQGINNAVIEQLREGQ